MDLTAVCAKPEEWGCCEGEGHVFLLPSTRGDAVSPWHSVTQMDVEELQSLLCQAICCAAGVSKAGCVVIDTTAIPEPCSAALASMCDFVILVSRQLNASTILSKHLHNLAELGPVIEPLKVELVINKVRKNLESLPVIADKAGFHVIPYLTTVDEDVINAGDTDNIALDSRICGILEKLFKTTCRHLVPRWCSPLPVGWRSLAERVNKPAPSGKRQRLWRWVKRACCPCVKRLLAPVALGFLGLVLLFLGVIYWTGPLQMGEPPAILWNAAVVIGLGAFVLGLYLACLGIGDLATWFALESKNIGVLLTGLGIGPGRRPWKIPWRLRRRIEFVRRMVLTL
ncbi:MAG: hypothetical protein NTX87_02565 [Planctomycetota bacterium]|nr:hypothetical protein [Planctomycetota bacterium]